MDQGYLKEFIFYSKSLIANKISLLYLIIQLAYLYTQHHILGRFQLFTPDLNFLHKRYLFPFSDLHNEQIILTFPSFTRQLFETTDCCFDYKKHSYHKVLHQWVTLLYPKFQYCSFWLFHLCTTTLFMETFHLRQSVSF